MLSYPSNGFFCDAHLCISLRETPKIADSVAIYRQKNFVNLPFALLIEPAVGKKICLNRTHLLLKKIFDMQENEYWRENFSRIKSANFGKKFTLFFYMANKKVPSGTSKIRKI